MYKFKIFQKQILGSLGPSPTSQPKLETSRDGVNKKDEIKSIISMATSGNVFAGKRMRQFPKDQIRYKGKLAPNFDSNELKPDGTASTKRASFRLDCKKWAVVTTIFSPPSEAVRRLLYRKEWCIVVVGDKDKPGKVHILFHLK